MDWLINLFTTQDSIAHIVLLYGIVIAIGIMLGKLKIGGISLGVTFVLFCGIVAGHFGFTGPTPILNFLQDFGLILFVFCIGLQVGPGFFESFKKGGVALNGMSVLMIFLNIIVMFACYYLFFDTSNKTNLPMMIGVLYGAVTNTPGLGAANEALTSVFTNGQIPQIANGYACAYPLGVLGIIGATILIRFITKTNLKTEEEELEAEEAANPHAKPLAITLEVSNVYLAGRTLSQISEFLGRDIVCTRILHQGEMTLPNKNTKFEVGDKLHIVCAEADAEAIKAFIGPETDFEWENAKTENQPMISKRVIVTNPKMNGKTLGKMHFSSVYGVNITRITRQGMDLFASRNHHFHIGDRVMVVGREENVNRVAELMGNSARSLNVPNIATIFIGIVIGILFGSIPIAVPGVPVPLKLGLAGGPLIIAILLGYFGPKLKITTYTTLSANMMIREIGISFFLAAVGLGAGENFISSIVNGGYWWILYGALITLVPVTCVVLLGRLVFKLNFYQICGLISGGTTNPPVLAFSQEVYGTNYPSISYATVYPLTMFMRVLMAQLIILFTL